MNRKLFISIGSLSSGGAERVVSILANRLSIDNYDVTIFTWVHSPIFYDINDDVRIVDLEERCGSKSNFAKARYFRNYIKNDRPNIILSFLAKINILVLICCLFLNVKVVVCERNDPRFVPFNRWLRYLRNMIYIISDRVLTQTDNNKNYFSDIIKSKTDIIYNPIFLDKDMVGSALHVVESKKIVSVGRLIPQKNHEMLLNAFAIFAKNHPDYSLYIYGEGSSRNELIALTQNLGITDKVNLPGVKKNIFQEIKDAEMFVLSSNFEGMPNTLIEAMCLGLPCISTKVSGAIDLIKNGENGFLVNVNDVSTLAVRMGEIADNKKLKQKIGASATNLYDMLNVDSIYGQWKAYIDKTMRQHG